MSDSPPNDTEMLEEEPSFSGGWQKPTTRGAWRAPEKQEAPEGWRVPMLPTELTQEPEAVGAWHLPDPEDTTFTEEDDTVILSPEDMVMNLPAKATPPEDDVLEAEWQDATSATEAIAPEDFAFGDAPRPAAEDKPVPVAPEDLLYLMEHIDEQEDEDEDSVPMSELIALASLSQEAGIQGAIHGEDSMIPAPLDVDEDEDDIELDKLSVAERLMLGGGQQQLEALGDAVEDTIDQDVDAAVDPAEYARQQMAQLGGTGGIESTPTESVDAESDPAAYARQQLQSLGMGQQPSFEDTPLPQATEPLDPRKLALIQQFRDTEAAVKQLRQQVQNGQISQEQYMDQLRQRMILDDDQNWWMLGVDSDQWYRSENNQWIPDTPPVLIEAQQREQSGTGRMQTGTFAPRQDSLAYLTEAGPANQRTGGQTSPTAGTYGEYSDPGDTPIPLDENFLPRRDVPLNDPDLTVPSPNVFDIDNTLPNNAATVPSSGGYGSYGNESAYDAGPTVMASPVGYGSIESAIDPTEPPDYDSYAGEGQQGGDIYKQAVEQQRRSIMRIVVIAAIVGFVFVALAGAVFIFAALSWYQGIVGDWEQGIAALENFEPEFLTVTVQDSAGRTIATLSREGDDRRPVSLDEMSPYLLHAAISVENPRFYQDPGWDFFAIMRAFAENLTAGEITSGGSTITQQVARSLVLQSTEVSAERKINEIVVAAELTNRYTKSQILELYLNEVAFFGNQSYGVEAASQFYFGKHAADLTLPESALLIAINNAPATNEPVNNRETALNLMRVVMDRMEANGCVTFQHNNETLCVTEDLLKSGQVAIDLARVQAQEFQPRQFSERYPHYTQFVREELESIFGSTELYRGGYTVTTTLDSSVQDFAQQALADRVAQLSTNGVNTGAILVTDPRTGAILAMIGSPDFDNEEIDGQVNNTLRYHQPGSAIKPVVYAAALSGVDFNGNGAADLGEYYTPATILWDVPTTYQGGYTPRNYDNVFHGPISLRSALQNSYNIPAIKTYEFIGNQGFQSMAAAMGFTFSPEAQFNLTTAVGSTDVRLFDMVQGFGTIANNGARMSLYTVESIVDGNGNPIPTPARPQPVQAMRPQVAYLLQNILSDDSARQPAFGLNSALVINGLPTQNYVGAKTGTTEVAADLWTMGFTSNRVVGVWLGTIDNDPTFGLSGFTAAAPLWNRVMQAALQGTDPRGFSPPTNGTVVSRQICAYTGTEPGNTCSDIRNEFFITSQPPSPADASFAVTLQVDSWTGLRANTFCPDNVIEQTYAAIADNSAVNWMNNTQQGQQYASLLGLQTPVARAPEQSCSQSTPIPVGRIATPQGGQTIQGSVAITGQVSAQDLNRYEIEYAPAGTENFIQISSSTTPQPGAGATLGNWDTTSVPNGSYDLRLAVFSATGGFLYRTVQVTVNNPLPTQTPTPQVFPTSPPAPQFTPLPFEPLPNNNQSASDLIPTVTPS